MQAEWREGDDPGPARSNEPACESCGRWPATEALERRPSRYAAITKQRIEPTVLLCRHCWLDILCGRKPMPPERARFGGARVSGAPGRSWSGSTPSEAFLRVGAAYRALKEATAGGFAARQERADFHESLAALRHHALTVCIRAQRLWAATGFSQARCPT